MKKTWSVAGGLLACAIFCAPAQADPKPPKPPKPPKSSSSNALPRGRAVYLGTLQEMQGWLFPPSAFDDMIVYNSIVWASRKATGPYNVLIIDSQETVSWGLWPAWTNFMIMHPDVVVTNTEADPIPYSFYELGQYDVLWMGNAWHGDPSQVTPPSPGGKSWVFTDQEIADIEQYVREGHGLVVTGGSFGQFARDPGLGYNNYKLASFMCLKSTGGGNAANADAFPWSRGNGAPYPPTRPTPAQTMFLYNDAPTHPIMTGIPTSYAIAPNNAMAQWMSLVAGSGAVQLAHYGVGVDQYQDSLNTACEVAP